MQSQAQVAAILGPTNTGKTHSAIERMLAHRTGVIGLPLRLLAREVYDRIVALRGPSVVALVTGEERIVPERTQYWVCTVEAMPAGIGCDFLAVDEIQLCADPERGHIFTDRLLHARGQRETLFLGADTMRSAIAAQVPKVVFHRQERFSELSYTGSKKISRMPSRAAIVAFSVENVYAIAELLRRTKGGAAVVMGALSPRTRNAQVQMYQEGEVDTLVATDAIGMGLNLDIKHVAFAGTRKFDGRRMRDLWPNELAQIAGRAGRHQTAGTFGVTGEAEPLSDEVVASITEHRFAPVKRLQWRNTDLDYGTARRLVASLEAPTQDEWLTRAREADDLMALKAIIADPAVEDRLRAGPDVRLMWDVCRIPDFRGISHAEHASLLRQIFEFLQELGRVPDDWLAGQVTRIDRTEGDLDTLSKRLAYIRTWTYVAQRSGWVDDESHWRETTRAVEDRLSDALHGALTQRFVDRRTSVLMRRLKQKESLVAEVKENGEVHVEGQFVGKLEGFRFVLDGTASGDEAKTLRQAALSALAPELHLRADRFYNAPDPEFDFTEQGGLMWGDQAVGKLVPGPDPLKPIAQAFVDDEAAPQVIEKISRRLQHFIDRKVAALYEPMLAMQKDEAITGLARGFAFRLVEGFGVIPRAEVAQEVKELDQDARAMLRKHKVRFGQYTIFMPDLLKPAPTRLRLVLWSLAKGLAEFPESPPPGLVTIPGDEAAPEGYFAMSGYRAAGARAIRIDMLERLADMLRNCDSRSGFEATPDMLSITGMTLEQFADLMAGLGYKGERGERERVRAAPVKPTAEAQGDGGDVPMAEAGQPEPDAAAAELGSEPVPEPGPEPATPDAPVEPEASTEAAPTPEADAVPAEAAPSESDSVEPVPEVSEGDAAPNGVEAAEPGPDIEVYYTFTWAPRRPQQQGGGKRGRGKPQGGGKNQGGGGGGGKHRGKPKGGKPKQDGPRQFSARPDKKDKIDPDNPFAQALAGLKGKT